MTVFAEAHHFNAGSDPLLLSGYIIGQSHRNLLVTDAEWRRCDHGSIRKGYLNCNWLALYLCICYKLLDL